jgi:hypothetical protein
MLGAAPVEHECFPCPSQIVHCDSDKSILPLQVLYVDLERPKIRRRKLARERNLRAKNRGIVDAAM